MEAWVDYFPSRGAKHRVGDRWVPKDASFKQYSYTQGMDLSQVADANGEAVDFAALAEQLQANAVIDEAQGFIQGFDQAALEQALQDYQAQLSTHIDEQNSEATLGDVLGTQKVIITNFPKLAPATPYTVVARTQHFTDIPDHLRHKFRYTLGTQQFDQEAERLITVEEPLTVLAGQKLAVAFKPATEVDEAVLRSYLPTVNEGETLDPSQFPQGLPGHLIAMQAEFLWGDQVVASSAAGFMGEELVETLSLYSPAWGWEQSDNTIIVGEYQAIGLAPQGANAAQLAELQTQLEATKAILESAYNAAIGALGGQKLAYCLQFSPPCIICVRGGI